MSFFNKINHVITVHISEMSLAEEAIKYLHWIF